MNAREAHGWHDDRPCPDWCVRGAEHLGERLRTGGDFWHESRRAVLRTADVDHNWEPVDVAISIRQREQVDERGHIRHAAQVSLHPGWEFRSDDARALAAAVLAAADQADAAPHDVPAP